MTGRPKSIWELLQETWPAQAAKSAYHGAMLPGQMASGELAVKPSVPGMLSDVDVAREQATQKTAMSRAEDLSGLAMTGGLPFGSTGVTLTSGLRKPPLIGGYHGTSVPDIYDQFKGGIGDLGGHMSVDPGVANIHANRTRENLRFHEMVPRVMPVVADVNKAFRFPADPTDWSSPIRISNALEVAARSGVNIPRSMLTDFEKIEAQPGGWKKNFIPAMEEKGFDSIFYPHRVLAPLASKHVVEPGIGKYNSFMLFKDKQMLPRFSEEGQALAKERGVREPLTVDPRLVEKDAYLAGAREPPVEPKLGMYRPPKGILRKYDKETIPGREAYPEVEKLTARQWDRFMQELEEARKANGF